MSSQMFGRLCTIREFKLERAQRELGRCRDALARREQALQQARDAHGLEVAHCAALAADWRQRRVALRAFDNDALDGHRAELARAERRIALAAAVVAQREAERDEAARQVVDAQQALLRCRVALNKAEQGVDHHRGVERMRDEAMEEDEMDELAVMRPAPAHGELRA